MLSRLGPTLKKLPDLERGATRALHGNARPADFAALLQQFSGLQGALGVGAELAGRCAELAGDDLAGTHAAAAGGNSSAATVAAVAGSQLPLTGLQGVQSKLLQQLLRAAADTGVAAAAREILGSLDLTAAAANDKLNVLQ